MTLTDSIMLLKDSVKTTFSRHPLLNRNATAGALIKYLKLKNVKGIINGKPNTTVILTDDTVIRIPLDKLSETRCRVNKLMLKNLTKTSIKSYVPRFLEEGSFQGRRYYCETRLPGVAIDLPISNMDDLVEKAADFITKFHQETAKKVTINEANYRRLFGREFQRLYPYLNDEYKTKLRLIEERVRKEIMGRQFKTVWMQGDYKIENILFNTQNWQINGVIDWDLSRYRSLPLLDIFYLLFYKEGLTHEKSVMSVFTERLSGFIASEKNIINIYLLCLNIPTDLIKPLLVMFWLNHVTQRMQQRITYNFDDAKNWTQKNIFFIIGKIFREYF